MDVIRDFALEALAGKSLGVLPDAVGGELTAALLIDLHRRDQARRRRFCKKNARRRTTHIRLIETDHGFPQAAPAKSNHRPSARLRLEGYDAEILLAGKDQRLASG